MGNQEERVKKKTHKHRSKSSLKYIALLAVSLVIGGAFYFYMFDKKTADQSAVTETVVQQSIPEPAPKKGTLKTLTGVQFRELYDSFAYPNTEYISDDSSIVGNVAADAHIRQLTEKRGYKTRSAPVADNFVEVEKDMTLQERASQPWIMLKDAAKKEGIGLYLTAAYRSADNQKQIFTERLTATGVDINKIAGGTHDRTIDQVLRMTAVPGYSRHHTGYTVDIGCDNDRFRIFDSTVCFEWLSKDNYKNAKTYGWIPSYPEGAGAQGPDPETWEYVWVGVDALTE